MVNPYRTFRLHYHLTPFLIPLFMVLAVVSLSQSALFLNNPEALAEGITIDLALTIPLVYFILIRKRKVPNFTIVPVFLLGIVIATLILPESHQGLLDWIKTWVFPIVELTVIGIVAFKVRHTIRLYRSERSAQPDFFAALKSASAQVLPSPVNVLFATEIAVLYYAIFNWSHKKRAEYEFTYHKNSGAIPILATLILLVIAETFVFHLLIRQWSDLVAWIASALSVYSALQVLGLIRSMYQLPIRVLKDEKRLELHYGIFGEASIPFDHIEEVKMISFSNDQEENTVRLSLLGEMEQSNVLVRLNQDNVLNRFYGIKRVFRSIIFYVDEPEYFVRQLNVGEINNS